MRDAIRNWDSTPQERQGEFPCDRHLATPHATVYRALTVPVSASAMYRWLCQLRVAPYSYDWIDNFGRRSPPQRDLDLARLALGDSQCRVVVKGLLRYPRWSPLRPLLYALLPGGDLIMMRRQLRNLAALATREGAR